MTRNSFKESFFRADLNIRAYFCGKLLYFRADFCCFCMKILIIRMKRKIYAKLLEWKNSPRRKPLISSSRSNVFYVSLSGTRKHCQLSAIYRICNENLDSFRNEPDEIMYENCSTSRLWEVSLCRFPKVIPMKNLSLGWVSKKKFTGWDNFWNLLQGVEDLTQEYLLQIIAKSTSDIGLG